MAQQWFEKVVDILLSDARGSDRKHYIVIKNLAGVVDDPKWELVFENLNYLKTQHGSKATRIIPRFRELLKQLQLLREKRDICDTVVSSMSFIFWIRQGDLGSTSILNKINYLISCLTVINEEKIDVHNDVMKKIMKEFEDIKGLAGKLIEELQNRARNTIYKLCGLTCATNNAAAPAAVAPAVAAPILPVPHFPPLPTPILPVPHFPPIPTLPPLPNCPPLYFVKPHINFIEFVQQQQQQLQQMQQIQHQQQMQQMQQMQQLLQQQLQQLQQPMEQQQTIIVLHNPAASAGRSSLFPIAPSPTLASQGKSRKRKHEEDQDDQNAQYVKRHRGP